MRGVAIPNDHAQRPRFVRTTESAARGNVSYTVFWVNLDLTALQVLAPYWRFFEQRNEVRTGL